MKYLYFFILLFVSNTNYSQQFKGNWNGNLDLGNSKLNLIFKIEENNTGYNVYLSIPKQGVTNMIADSVIVKNYNLEVYFKKLGANYKGVLSKQNGILGKFTQSSFNFKLNLSKGINTLLKHQEPLKPYSYIEEKILFKNIVDGITLGGTLTYSSKNNKPSKVIILINGSGPQNRDYEVFGHKPFLVLGDFLTKEGFIVLRIDDRGVNLSEGNFDISNFDDYISDIESAIIYLKNKKNINIKSLGLLGHSLGGVIAAKVAIKKNNKIDFIINMASPGVQGDKILLKQKEYYEKNLNIDELIINQGQVIFGGAYDKIKKLQKENNLKSIKDSLGVYFEKKLGLNRTNKQIDILVTQMSKPWMLDFISIDPSKIYSNITCPILFLNGEKDTHVNSKINLETIKNTFKKSHNKNVTILEIENLNHLFQNCKTGNRSEYSEISETISPKVFNVIRKWISQNKL